MFGIFRRKQRRDETSDQIRYDSDRISPSAPLRDFGEYLLEAGFTENLSSTELYLLYCEFCLHTNSEHLTEGQFFRRIRASGIERYRLGVGSRPWRYRLLTIDTASTAED